MILKYFRKTFMPVTFKKKMEGNVGSKDLCF